MPAKGSTLSMSKCDHCRRSKVRCLPEAREWPAEKCIRCSNLGLPCSENKIKRRETARRRAATSVSADSQHSSAGSRGTQHGHSPSLAVQAERHGTQTDNGPDQHEGQQDTNSESQVSTAVSPRTFVNFHDALSVMNYVGSVVTARHLLYGVCQEGKGYPFHYWPIREDSSSTQYIFGKDYEPDWVCDYDGEGYGLTSLVLKDMQNLSGTVPGIMSACFAAFVCCNTDSDSLGRDYSDTFDLGDWDDVRIQARKTISSSITRSSATAVNACGLALRLLYDELERAYPTKPSKEHLPELSDQIRNTCRQIRMCCVEFQAILPLLARQFGGGFRWPSRFLESPMYFRTDWWPLYADSPDTWQLRDSSGRLALHVVLEGLKKNNGPPSLRSDPARRDLFKRILDYVKGRPLKLCTDSDGRSPLHFAIQIGLEDFATAMISGHIGIDVRDADGRSPLHYAVVMRSSKSVSLLLENGADPGCLDKCTLGPGRCPLAYLFWIRSMENDESKPSYMRGLGPNLTRTAAAETKDLSILDCFVRTLGKDINSCILEGASGEKITALAAAVDQLWVAGIQRLEAGVDFWKSVYGADTRRNSILHFAVNSLLRQKKCEKEQITAFLSQIAPHFNLSYSLANCANLDGHTALSFLANREPTPRQLQIAEQLILQPGLSTDATETKGRRWTPLHYAAAHDNSDLCRLLCSRTDSGLYARDNDGLTPLDIASRKGARRAHAALEEALHASRAGVYGSANPN